MAVIFHRLAAREFVAARRWYARRSAAATRRFLTALATVVQAIDINPTAGSPLLGPYRWMRVPRYPYLLYYEQTGATTVKVYAVAHASRRPGYWLRRVNQP